ncbi:hypothetical protein D3C76_1410350 [compost metagenome]
MFDEGGFTDANHLRFCFITVGDKPAFKPGGTAGNIGDGFCHPPAGTGLRRSDRRTALFQRLPYPLTELHQFMVSHSVLTR